MMTDFVSTYAKMIVNYPEDVEVHINEIDPTFFEIVVNVNESDIGKLIGKNGNMINAIKTILNGCKAKDGISYKIQILAR
ncbi:MAG: KH domain-containing protein [Campylobacterota bacterium]|nr:KH domain-containing protein [Campylobacterota bacterium]